MTGPDPRTAAATRQQEQAVRHPAPLYVSACPGAGKTRVIVDRHLADRRGARGRAVLSFTNVACDEVARRCRQAGKPELAAFPNYVGTIDTFLWRYLVRPFLTPGRIWHRIESWDRIDATVEVGFGTNQHKVFLNDFNWSRDPDARQCTAQLQPKKRAIKSYTALAKQGRLDEAALAVVRKRKTLIDQGYVTGHEIRVLALQTLRRRHTEAVAMLSGRFDEIVVDEAQDCSAHDLAILGLLHDAGIPLVFVCDPDQAIYEFRGAQPANIRAFGESLGARVDLQGNWRSSPAICGLAATLRPATVARPADSPVGPNRDEPAGILLIGTKGSQPDEALAVFNDHADKLGIATERRVVLAHAGTTLPSTTATPATQPPANYPARVAWAATIAKSNHRNPSLRHLAYDILQRAILRYWYTEADTADRSVEAICASVDVDPWRLRQLAGKLAVALPDVDHGTFADWCREATNQLKLLPPAPGMLRLDTSGRLSAVAALKDKTPRAAAGVISSDSMTPVRTSVIHQVKGEEEEAVLVIVPSNARTDGLVDAWIAGSHPPDVAENLRVLYVAATRARRLLAIAMPEDAQKRVAALLELKDVAFELTTT
ncbi:MULTISPECIES: UvrD-helicase domain-containing protein [unclassified Amycolatopsis]|uniref:UvrD-helicase domain-containing protein n=1 Tax=unclassified Amycolatopsis TaxID=2618356 RepID=UPI001C6984B6|nr:UvrD-helicase domain-containing protein [Amycolatopsis sp. DSM 110486]QYN20135.1 UvrD-helicase domain-containing protein [Amycolatopsis sp. DSM 110486]